MPGCAIWNSFLDPSSVGPNALFKREGTLDIRTSLSLQDTPPGGAEATDPLPDDLVPIVKDYRYEIGDALTIRVFQLLGRNTETAVQPTIDENGKIVIPTLGEIHVAGLTRSEIEAEIVDAIVRKGLVLEPEVIVEPAVRRKLSYTVYGTVSQPNIYPLGQYDLKLLQAINLAGGFLDSVNDIYVTRGEETPPPVLEPSASKAAPGRERAARASLSMSEAHVSAGAMRQPVEPRTDPAPAGQPPAEEQPTDEPPADETQPGQDIIDTMVSERATAPGTEEEGSAPIAPTPSQPRWIWYNDRWVETQPSEPATRRETPVVEGPTDVSEPATRPTIDWDQIAGEGKQRVIKISAEALRNGDARQNIIVRPGDTIRLASGEFGEYYLTGQVARPGAYSLTGRNITLKAAISAAGDLGPLAWPTHCTIFRRYGDREEMRHVDLDAIFAGREQDLFVRKDDLIFVGTTPLAPFLAVLRNSFRASYGFGFVYDRNFADIDAFSAKPNPEFRQPRFPNLFPDQ